jgi:hypothetical protein
MAAKIPVVCVSNDESVSSQCSLLRGDRGSGLGHHLGKRHSRRQLDHVDLTTTCDVRPVALGIYQYLGAYVSNWSSVMAAAVLASIPGVVLLLVAQRFVVAGLSDGVVR